MPDGLDQLNREEIRDHEQPQAFEAVVATAPAAPGDELRVTIPGFDGGRHDFACLGWQPRVEGPPVTLRLPATGDRALVLVSGEGDTWAIGWWPGDYD